MSLTSLPDTVKVSRGTAGSDRRSLLLRLDLPVMAVIVVVFIGLALLADSNYWSRILTSVAILGAASTGWNILGGYAAQLSLGHAAFFGLGMYGVAIVFGEHEMSPWLGIAAGIAASVIVALLIGAPTFRLSGHYFALGTLAVLQVFLILATVIPSLTGGAQGIYLPLRGEAYNLIFEDQRNYLYVGLVVLVIALVVAAVVRRSKLGVQLDAIRLNEAAASLSGVNVFHAKMKAFVLSAAIASLAGSAYMTLVQFVDPPSGFAWNTTLNLVLFAIVGGMRFWWGPLLGAAILVPLEEVTKSQFTGNMVAVGDIVFGVLLILFVILQPRGIGGALVSLGRGLRRKERAA
ncbi:Branched-chain amino acid transport system permease protein LivM (TC 3.A.1.4.1) [Actinomycetales bacterium JB111]|nr:Branched-chain amino acid transport system permease protein LivM (TC 3.A.1.4.1) [Actinomycetales bacterium JB111]